MKKFLSLLLCAFCVWCASAQHREIKVLQWNIWQEGTIIKGGYDAIVDEVARLEPDFVTLSEVRNYKDDFCRRLTRDLAERYGKTYYSFRSDDTGLLSRYPIRDSVTIFPLMDDHGTVHRMVTEMDGVEFAVYTGHLDYRSDAYYNVRGYHGTTWDEIPIPTTVAEILNFNDASLRDDAVRCFIRAARRDIEAGRIVIFGGDFNEPSHMDWTRETKDLYDHHGFIVPWTVTLELDNAGFVDTYRTLYPDVLKYPGFTFPSYNPHTNIRSLTWAPKADERDRIDYVFYYPDARLELTDALIFGPRESVVRCQCVEESSCDKFLLPQGIWPTDHKGLLVTFRWRKDKK